MKQKKITPEFSRENPVQTREMCQNSIIRTLGTEINIIWNEATFNRLNKTTTNIVNHTLIVLIIFT